MRPPASSPGTARPSFSDVKLYTAQGYVSGGSDNPTTAATGLVLDGPDFVLSGSEPWRGRLVNTEGYALPESIHVALPP